MIPTTMAELRAEVRRRADPNLTSIVETGKTIRVRRKGDRDPAGIVLEFEEGSVYSRSPTEAVRSRVWSPDEIGVLVRSAADGHFSPLPCWECDDMTFGTNDQGLPSCGCGGDR